MPKLMLRVLCLILMVLTLPCAAQLNYQERALYLGEADNVCYYGEDSDIISLVINIDGSQLLKVNISGGTMCYEWVLPYAASLAPSPYFQYLNLQYHHLIRFNGEKRYVRFYGVIVQVIHKATILSAKLYGKQYDCTIRGDGTVQHFGVRFQDFDPATINIKCIPKDPTTKAA